MEVFNNIKNLHDHIKDSGFIDEYYEKVSEEFGVKKETLRTSWFSPNRMAIPEKYGVPERLNTFTQNFIQNKNKTAVH